MLGRKGPWTVQQAKDWLRTYDWGVQLAETLEEGPTPVREEAWVRMVMGMYVVMHELPAAGWFAVDAGVDGGIDLVRDRVD